MAYDIERIRAQFPALSGPDAEPVIHLDGPAGTQVPQRVLDRVREALLRFNANLGGSFKASREATAVSEAAHAAMADFLNAASAREIVFGANMTTLAFLLSRSLGPRFQPGDEMILTRMEHDANVTPWRIMAEERGMVVKTLEFDRETHEFDMTQLDSLLSPRTRFAAIGLASNLIGTINDVRGFCARTRAAGAITFVDAVQYAPHGPIDVAALGTDFLACSAYKFFGPHQGVLYGREARLEELKPYKLRACTNELPTRFETGTPSVEGQAGTLGAIEYLEWVGATFGAAFRAQFPGMSGRRQTLHAAMAAIADYERRLSARLIERLAALPGVTIHGITAQGSLARRVPTVSISVAGADPAALEQALAARGVYCWSGSSYALDVVEHLRVPHPHGVLRLGASHYTRLEEIDRAIELLAAVRGR